MSREFDPIDRSYQDLDPDLADARERERVAGNRFRKTIEAQARLDRKTLSNNPAFIRWLLSELLRAGILDPTFHAHEGSTQYLAGFRAFGLAMLKDLEAEDPTIMVALMVERSKSLEKAKNDRHDRTDDRDPE
jgi:hypothetical protein